MEDIPALTHAVELMAAGSWAVEGALRCLDADHPDEAYRMLVGARETLHEGLSGLRSVLEESVRAAYERPTRLARALEALEQLRDLAPAGSDEVTGAVEALEHLRDLTPTPPAADIEEALASLERLRRTGAPPT